MSTYEVCYNLDGSTVEVLADSFIQEGGRPLVFMQGNTEVAAFFSPIWFKKISG